MRKNIKGNIAAVGDKDCLIIRMQLCVTVDHVAHGAVFIDVIDRLDDHVGIQL